MRLNTIKKFIDKKILISLNSVDNANDLIESLNVTKAKFDNIILSEGVKPSMDMSEIEDISIKRIKYSNYMVWCIQRRINDTYDYLEPVLNNTYFPHMDIKTKFKTILFKEHLSGEIDYYNEIKEI